MHLMTATKKSISALEMQRQLGRTRVAPMGIEPLEFCIVNHIAFNLEKKLID